MSQPAESLRIPSSPVTWDEVVARDWTDPEKRFVMAIKAPDDFTYSGLISGAEISGADITFRFSSVRTISPKGEESWKQGGRQAFRFGKHRPSTLATNGSFWISMAMTSGAEIAPATPQQLEAFRRFEATSG